MTHINLSYKKDSPATLSFYHFLYFETWKKSLTKICYTKNPNNVYVCVLMPFLSFVLLLPVACSWKHFITQIRKKEVKIFYSFWRRSKEVHIRIYTYKKYKSKKCELYSFIFTFNRPLKSLFFPVALKKFQGEKKNKEI